MKHQKDGDDRFHYLEASLIHTNVMFSAAPWDANRQWNYSLQMLRENNFPK